MIRHFVTDRRRFGLTVDGLMACIERAVADGVDVVQLREPDLSDRDLAALASRALDAARGRATRIVVNDRPDVAIAAGAAGVHLRGDSVAASRVAAFAADIAPASRAPGRFMIGRSVHSLAEIDAAVADGACDYLMFGTVFRSAGKPDGHPVAGLDALGDACRRSPIPVIAIGGMTPARAADAVSAGAAGVAAVGMFM
jgi:thiamine-phosphate diphosphorylase